MNDPTSTPTIQDLAVKVRESLDKLVAVGDADQIALELEAQGIQSIPGCSDQCVIADYIAQQTGIAPGTVAVATESCQISETTYGPGPISFEEIRIPHHPAISDLIHKFDLGYYPNLLSPKGKAKLARTKLWANSHPSSSKI